MKKKILIIVLSLVLICVFAFFALKILTRRDYEEYVNSNGEWSDSSGGSLQKPDNFTFRFVNQEDFENAVDAHIVEIISKTDNELLFYGDWTFISYDGTYITAKDSMDMICKIEVTENGVSVMGSY